MHTLVVCMGFARSLCIMRGKIRPGVNGSGAFDGLGMLCGLQCIEQSRHASREWIRMMGIRPGGEGAERAVAA